jgi:hypothetical protein
MLPGCERTLLADRTIHCGLARHKHLPPQLLITTLVAALEAARAQARSPVLPELPAMLSAPLASA